MPTASWSLWRGPMDVRRLLNIAKTPAEAYPLDM